MYTQPIILREHFLNRERENIYLIPEENKKLCRDICVVSSCLMCVCMIYCIFFLGIAHNENLYNLTYF